MRGFRTQWVCILLGLASSCATSSGRDRVDMEAVHIRARPDPLTGLETFDAGDLLERGNALFDSEDFDHAIKVYDRLLSAFPESSLAATALYNTGLCYERLDEWDPAVARFRRVIEHHPKSSTARDAHYRLGLALSKLGRWGDVEKIFWSARQLDDLDPMDDLEARVGLAIALFMQDDYATAEREFLSALRFYEEHSQKAFLPAQYWVGQSRFYLGEIAARQFEKIALSSDETEHEKWTDDLAAKLEAKCTLLLRAQNNFIRTIREGHTGWATAAGFRIGSMYERLYEDVVQVAAPPGIGDEAKAYYTKEVKSRVAALVSKAILIYERSLDMAQRVGESNEWVKRTEKALDRMKSLALQSMESS